MRSPRSTRRDPLPVAGVLLALFAACGPDATPATGGESPGARQVDPRAADPPEPRAGAPFRVPGTFDDEAVARGLDYRNRSGEPHKATILEANGAGVAVLDLGSDGDLDLAFGQGLATLVAAVAGPGADLALFANDGSGAFAAAAGPGLSGWWTGLAAGDVDGDGRTDLVAGGYGGLELLRQGAGGALEVVEAAGLRPSGTDRLVPGDTRPRGRAPLWTTSVALFDADRDGALDLYVGRYLDLDPLDPPLGSLGEGALELPCWWKGHGVYCGPRGLPAQPDRLFRGDGRGRFEDRSAASLPELPPAYTLALAAFDADGDGDTDLYVANDSVPNRLLVNDGGGRFEDYAPQSGVAVDADGAAQAGMGVAVGDVDRDGLLDLAVTNFSDEPTELYLGAEVGFRSVTHRVGLGRATRRLLSWGVHLVDFDGDSYLDLFTANGHVYPQADEPYTGTSHAQHDSLFRLTGSEPVRAFELAGERSILALRRGSRASAVGDFDGDGAPDLVLTTIDGPAVLGINRLDPAAHRLAILCRGPREPSQELPRTPPDGRGARVLVVPVVPPGVEPYGLLAEAQTSGSYQSSSTPWLHFGLGAAERVERIEVHWPSGRVEALPGGASDRRLVVREGEGIVAESSLP